MRQIMIIISDRNLPMAMLLNRYVLRPALSLTGFLLMVLLIPLSIALTFLIAIASFAIHNRLRQSNSTETPQNPNDKSRPRNSTTHNSGRPNVNPANRAPIEGSYTILENK